MSDRIDQRAFELFGPDFSGAVQRMLSRLRRQFPGAFGTVKPLALGIRDAIASRTNLSEAEVAQFMTFYTRSASYLRAQAQPGAMRVDLDGNAVEPVSRENRLYAVARLHEEMARRQEHTRWLAFRTTLLDPVIIPEEGEL